MRVHVFCVYVRVVHHRTTGARIDHPPLEQVGHQLQTMLEESYAPQREAAHVAKTRLEVKAWLDLVRHCLCLVFPLLSKTVTRTVFSCQEEIDALDEVCEVLLVNGFQPPDWIALLDELDSGVRTTVPSTPLSHLLSPLSLGSLPSPLSPLLGTLSSLSKTVQVQRAVHISRCAFKLVDGRPALNSRDVCRRRRCLDSTACG